MCGAMAWYCGWGPGARALGVMAGPVCPLRHHQPAPTRGASSPGSALDFEEHGSARRSRARRRGEEGCFETELGRIEAPRGAQ